MTDAQYLALLAAILLAGNFNDNGEDAIMEAQELIRMAQAKVQEGK